MKNHKKKKTHTKRLDQEESMQIRNWIRQIDQFTDMMKNVVLKKTVEFEEKPLK